MLLNALLPIFLFSCVDKSQLVIIDEQSEDYFEARCEKERSIISYSTSGAVYLTGGDFSFHTLERFVAGSGTVTIHCTYDANEGSYLATYRGSKTLTFD